MILSGLNRRAIWSVNFRMSRGSTMTSSYHSRCLRAAPVSLFRHEFQRCGIDAVSLARWARAVVENVPEVRAAGGVHYFGAAINIAFGHQFHGRFGYGFGETRPARAGIEFVGRTEQRDAGRGADVHAFGMVVPICVVERRLRLAFKHHRIRFSRQAGQRMVSGATTDRSRSTPPPTPTSRSGSGRSW
jgi:hypothetical protein